jgi:murein DD-endopeptidase MepM/ murein hydrolase activator NlpD
VALAGSVGLHVWSLQGLRALGSLKKENATLRDHLGSVDRALTQVEGMVREGERMEHQARLLAGLQPASPEAAPGLGGPLLTAPAAGAQGPADPALRRTVSEQSHRLDALAQKASDQRRSLEETLSTLKSLGTRLEHTPSVSPLRAQHVLSSGFGWRPDPFTGGRAFHSGLDLRAPHGTPIHATAAGEVTEVGHEGEFGLTIHVGHGYGVESIYCHLAASRVRPGDEVRRGEVIGTVGTSGRTTGSHLHYEVHEDGVARDPSTFILNSMALGD